MRKTLLVLTCLTLLALTHIARADQATPIIEQGNQVGDRTTVQGFIVSLGHEINGLEQYVVIVHHGCMRDVLYTIPAQAEPGVVERGALGIPIQLTVLVTEAITVNENGWVRGKVQIVSALVMECEG